VTPNGSLKLSLIGNPLKISQLSKMAISQPIFQRTHAEYCDGLEAGKGMSGHSPPWRGQWHHTVRTSLMPPADGLLRMFGIALVDSPVARRERHLIPRLMGRLKIAFNVARCLRFVTVWCQNVVS